jgi:hypothetical protein
MAGKFFLIILMGICTKATNRLLQSNGFILEQLRELKPLFLLFVAIFLRK